MDHNRDNPLKRFTAFWIALLLVGCFGIACVILRPLTHRAVDTAYQEASAARLDTKAAYEEAQSAAIDEEKLSKAISEASKTLSATPTAGAMPLPGVESK
ncbi:MAG: hypothetical protein ACON5H_06995 [Akkermansiaceae bacterium]